MLSIIVPVYNEEDSVVPLYERIVEVLDESMPDFEVVYVDDGSTDASVERLEQLAERDERVKVIVFRRNYGQTAAMMAGFDAAAGDVIVPLDGDMQNDPADIPRLLEKLDEGYDVVSGWRANRKDNALIRNFPSRVANRLISWISGVHLHDYGCSLKAYRREVVKGVRLYGEMHRFIPIYASWEGARVAELPVDHHPRRHGKSKYGLERTLKVLLDLIVVKYFSSFFTKPIYVFGGFGAATMAAGVGCLGWAIGLAAFGGAPFLATPLPAIATMCLVGGALAILGGLLAELVVRTYHECQGKTTYRVGRTINTEPVSVPMKEAA